MNAAVSPKRRLIALGAVAAAVVLGGCANMSALNPTTDSTSPAAARVDALARADQTYPEWKDFPAEPQGVPTPAEFGGRVLEVEADQSLLARQVAAIDWTINYDPQAWAAEVSSRIDRRLAQPAPANALAEAEAYAAALRRRAAPPPPIR